MATSPLARPPSGSLCTFCGSPADYWLGVIEEGIAAKRGTSSPGTPEPNVERFEPCCERCFVVSLLTKEGMNPKAAVAMAREFTSAQIVALVNQRRAIDGADEREIIDPKPVTFTDGSVGVFGYTRKKLGPCAWPRCGSPGSGEYISDLDDNKPKHYCRVHMAMLAYTIDGYSEAEAYEMAIQSLPTKFDNVAVRWWLPPRLTPSSRG